MLDISRLRKTTHGCGIEHEKNMVQAIKPGSESDREHRMVLFPELVDLFLQLVPVPMEYGRMSGLQSSEKSTADEPTTANDELTSMKRI
mmetsp:Transcript_23947/g.49790  ORF Transcript_23947/g.49790 Transcript_23947/m.49790 type:complete len:89 (-) Transcript_23947:486-752(-)